MPRSASDNRHHRSHQATWPIRDLRPLARCVRVAKFSRAWSTTRIAQPRRTDLLRPSSISIPSPMMVQFSTDVLQRSPFADFSIRPVHRADLYCCPFENFSTSGYYFESFHSTQRHLYIIKNNKIIRTNNKKYFVIVKKR